MSEDGLDPTADPIDDFVRLYRWMRDDRADGWAQLDEQGRRRLLEDEAAAWELLGSIASALDVEANYSRIAGALRYHLSTGPLPPRGYAMVRPLTMLELLGEIPESQPLKGELVCVSGQLLLSDEIARTIESHPGDRERAAAVSQLATRLRDRPRDFTIVDPAALEELRGFDEVLGAMGRDVVGRCPPAPRP